MVFSLGTLFLCSIVCLQQHAVLSFAPSSSSSSSVSVSSLSVVPTSTRLLAETTAAGTSSSSSSSTDEESTSEMMLLKRDRYVATNRFSVRAGKEGKFEQRWANRKSRLATLDGFKYFHLMRRVDPNKNGGEYVQTDENGESMGNYVSFTIWEKKSHFSAWRTGEAFKEAHGGTSIGAFVSTMVSSALILKGAPRPAFYDGLLVQSMTPQDVPKIVDGWRSISSNDSDNGILPSECFVACNQFFVPSTNAVAFEQRWANRESKLKDCPGFIGFTMMRRDIKSNKGHGTVPMDSDTEPTYLSTTLWKDQASFQAWRESTNFSKAHGSSSSSSSSSSSDKPKEDKKPAGPPKPLWTKPPVPVFYEGKLVITTENGV